MEKKILMTKSKLVGRGGARAGAGRKKKPVAGPTRVVGDSRSDDERGSAAKASAPIIPANLSAEDLKKFCEALAYETLATIAMTGTSENARVAASRELFDRVQGKPKPGAAAKSDQLDLLADDGWGNLLMSKQPAAGRTN
jgi:hypothetical protein